jgi:hypothetical protein
LTDWFWFAGADVSATSVVADLVMVGVYR